MSVLAQHGGDEVVVIEPRKIQRPGKVLGETGWDASCGVTAVQDGWGQEQAVSGSVDRADEHLIQPLPQSTVGGSREWQTTNRATQRCHLGAATVFNARQTLSRQG